MGGLGDGEEQQGVTIMRVRSSSRAVGIHSYIITCRTGAEEIDGGRRGTGPTELRATDRHKTTGQVEGPAEDRPANDLLLLEEDAMVRRERMIYGRFYVHVQENDLQAPSYMYILDRSSRLYILKLVDLDL
jgi:hypothetical protein